MKKIFCVVVFALAVFAFSASAEVVQFPSLRITIDVEPGWAYEDDGEDTATIYTDGSNMTVSKIDPEGAPIGEFAAALSERHSGTQPQQEPSSGMYYYHFNDNKTMICVLKNPAGKEFVVVGITAGSPEAQQIMLKMLSSSKDF